MQMSPGGSLHWAGKLKCPGCFGKHHFPPLTEVSPVTTAKLRWRKWADILQPFSDRNSLFELLAMTLDSGDQCGKGGGPVSSNCWSPFLCLGLAPWLTHTWCIKISSFFFLEGVWFMYLSLLPLWGSYPTDFLLQFLLWRFFLLIFVKFVVRDMRGT